MDGKDLNTKSHQKNAGVAVLMSAVACLRAAEFPGKEADSPGRHDKRSVCGLHNRDQHG